MGSFLYELPSPKHGIARWVAGGWQMNGILTAQTGTPFNIVSGTDRVFSGTGTQRPDAIRNPNLDTGRSKDELLAMYYDPKAFVLPALGSYGNVGRNTMVGPGRWNLDSALFKRFPIREKMRLEFRWEFFNFFNHPNLGQPVANISSNTAGRITSASAGRIMQLGLRLVF